jgi:CheY-like chemotaxis protein
MEEQIFAQCPSANWFVGSFWPSTATLSFWKQSARQGGIDFASLKAPLGKRTEMAVQKRILVVEDIRDARKSLRLLLELWGYTVAEAADGRRGVEEGLCWHPQVAIVDIGLPVLNGFEVARQLRDALHDEIYLIALTAYDEPNDALDAGFDLHLWKPAEPKELKKTLVAVAQRFFSLAHASATG